MSGGRLYSNSEVISPPSIACFCFMVKLVYLCAQSNQRARCPTSFTVIGWLYKTPVSNSLDNSPPSLLAGRRTEPLSDSVQMTTIDNQIFFSHALTSYGFKKAPTTATGCNRHNNYYGLRAHGYLPPRDDRNFLLRLP